MACELRAQVCLRLIRFAGDVNRMGVLHGDVGAVENRCPEAFGDRKMYFHLWRCPVADARQAVWPENLPE
jgi:hypothetical protein